MDFPVDYKILPHMHHLVLGIVVILMSLKVSHTEGAMSEAPAGLPSPIVLGQAHASVPKSSDRYGHVYCG